MALKGDQSCVEEIVSVYKSRRDILIEGLDRIGWQTDKPKGTMFVWARIPEPFRWMGSVGFSKYLIEEAKVAVSPGLGFGEYGDEFVRFALVENEMRTKTGHKRPSQGVAKNSFSSEAGERWLACIIVYNY